MSSIEAKNPTKFALTQGDGSGMLRDSHLNEDMSDTKNSMIAYGKGLQKKSVKLSKSIQKMGKKYFL